jgi:D-alanyl-D-alanine carboxypeptidase
MAGHRIPRLTALSMALFAAAWAGPFQSPAEAAPALVVDAATGDVLYQEEATEPWFPASLTKLMTLYVALAAVRDHKITLDTPLVVSARAASMPPSKMGFVPGTEVTLDNALRMLLVRSANDLAITVAEGVSGSVEAFAEDMNAAAAALGLRESHFVNPNGLPDPRHVSSARDMALLARALYANFPDHTDYYNLGALALNSEVITNHNNLLGRYPGADGMKTGFTCPAGFNIVASAMRGNRRLIVVVMGAPSVPLRTSKVAVLFDRGFGGIDRPVTRLADLGPSSGDSAPDMRDQICRRRGKVLVQFNAELSRLTTPFVAEAGPANAPVSQPTSLFSTNSLFHSAPVMTRVDLVPTPVFTPYPVFIGRVPGYVGPVAQARPAHSPVGTEAPPETASSYAPSLPALDTSKMPLKPDPEALPIRGRHGPKLLASKPKPVADKLIPTPTPVVKTEAKITETKSADSKTPDAKIDEPPAHDPKSKAKDIKSKAIKPKSAVKLEKPARAEAAEPIKPAAKIAPPHPKAHAVAPAKTKPAVSGDASAQ